MAERSKKPEIEILPVAEGVQAVDDWFPVYGVNKKTNATELIGWDIPEEDRVLKIVNHDVVIEFDKIYDLKNTGKLESKKIAFNTFYLRYKDSYISKVHLIVHYINYFIKYYDHDSELISNYLRTKFYLDVKCSDIIDISDLKKNASDEEYKKHIRNQFITFLYSSLITPTIYEKIKKMVHENYRIDLAQTNTENIKYSESLEFTNKHAKYLLLISVAIKIMIPAILHFITLYMDKKEIHNLVLYYKPIFDYIKEHENVNLYGKLQNSINVKVNLSESKNKVIWDKYEVEMEDTATYSKELLDKNIIVDNVFKYLFIKNIIAFNSVIIDTQLDFFVIKNLNINMREISTEKDSEGLSSLDKLEMNTTKIDESLIVLSQINIKKVIKEIKNKMQIKISKAEIRFYQRYLKINSIGKSLLFYYYAKYFDGYRDLNGITIKQYIYLMILMKRALQIKGDIYLPQLVSAQISDRINTRTIHNQKLLDKIQSSEAYSRLIKDKYSTLQGMGKSDVIIQLLSSLINTQFTICDYDLKRNFGDEITIDFDMLSQEYLDFITQI